MVHFTLHGRRRRAGHGGANVQHAHYRRGQPREAQQQHRRREDNQPQRTRQQQLPVLQVCEAKINQPRPDDEHGKRRRHIAHHRQRVVDETRQPPARQEQHKTNNHRNQRRVCQQLLGLNRTDAAEEERAERPAHQVERADKHDGINQHILAQRCNDDRVAHVGAVGQHGQVRQHAAALVRLAAVEEVGNQPAQNHDGKADEEHENQVMNQLRTGILLQAVERQGGEGEVEDDFVERGNAVFINELPLRREEAAENQQKQGDNLQKDSHKLHPF